MDSLEKAGTLRNSRKNICFVVMKTGNISGKFQNGKSFRYRLFSEVPVPQRFSNCGASKLGSTISCAIDILLTVLGTLANLKPHFSSFVFFSASFPGHHRTPKKETGPCHFRDGGDLGAAPLAGDWYLCHLCPGSQ